MFSSAEFIKMTAASNVWDEVANPVPREAPDAMEIVLVVPYLAEG